MAGIVWEVRNAGNDTNGGGFVAGGTGTDYSQQDNKNTGSNDKSTTDAVTGATTTLTSATANFGTTVVDNIIYLAGGTGSLAGAWYHVVSRTNSTTIVLDRAPGVSTGVTMNIGGALKTLAVFSLVMSAGDKCFVKADGTYTPTASIALASGATPGGAASPNALIGYTSSRTDRGRVTVQATTNSGITIFNCTDTGWWIQNFILDCNSLATSVGVKLASYCTITNSSIKNFTSAGVLIGATTCSISDCEITGGTSAATGCIDLQNTYTGATIQRNYMHDCSCSGIVNETSVPGIVALNNVIANMSGASSDGIRFDYGMSVIGNSIYNCSRDGIRSLEAYMMNSIVKNNILVNNGGYGLNCITAANPAHPNWDGNAYYNNTSGNRNNLDNTGTSVTNTNGVSPYTNVLDVTLTGVPFTNAGAGDFSLNNVAGQGAACRETGSPGGFVGGSFTGYLDMGAVQHNAVTPLFVRAGNG